MSDKTQNILDSIKTFLMERPLSISEISEKSNINWRTAENYLEMLRKLGLVEEKEIKNTRTFFYRDKDHYFDLPIKNEDTKLISSIYSRIKETCLKLYGKEPTKTQAYKIIWKLNNDLNLGLPVGWYRYGPCCVQVYEGNETKEVNLTKSQTKEIINITKEYCALDKISLQRKVYQDAKDNLYITKESLCMFDSDNKQELNLILIDLIKSVPQETIEVTTDFARATLLLKWEKTKTIFDIFWKYITMIKFRESLRNYYQFFDLDIYMDEKISIAKREAQLEIMNLVQSHLKSK